MNKINHISEEEKKAIINYLSGTLSGADTEKLNNWLGKSENNKLLFDRLSDIWQASYSNITDKQVNIEKAWRDLKSQMKLKNNIKTIINWKQVIHIAAIFIFALILGGLGYYFIDKSSTNNSTPQFIEYVSPLGSRSFVKLADGSKVWLNAGSTLKYKHTYGENNRDLTLSGEAFFEVAKNKELPFIVKTSDIDVIAIGTKFNVKAYTEDNTIETTLIEGSVQLESTTVKLKNKLILKPNEKAIFTKKGCPQKLVMQQPNKTKPIICLAQPMLEILKSVEPAAIISWKEKRWIINNEKLGSLAIKLERRYNVNLIFDNELLKEYSFGGTLEDETIEQIMKAISYSSPIKYIIDNKTVYIMADGQKIEKFKDLLME